MSLAEQLTKTRGRTAIDELDEKKLGKRVKTASNHLRKLSMLAPQLSVADFNTIRDSLNAIVDVYQKTYEKPKTSAPAPTTGKTS